MAHVLIAGAGYVGIELAGILRAAGHRVTGLRRTPPVADHGIAWIAADVAQPDTLAALPHDIDAVVCAMAPAGHREADYRAVYVDGPANLLAALGPRRDRGVLLTSSTGVYGCDNGDWVDEDTPPQPTTATGRVLLEGEWNLLKLCPGATVVRFSGIYGPGRTLLVDRVLARRPVQKEPPAYTNRIHRDDAARVLAWLVSQQLAGARLPECLVASDDDPAPMAEVLAYIAELLDVPPPPAAPAEAGASRNKRCRNDRLRELGYTFLYPSYREGYEDLVG
ncbi:MAG TPA: SDR family oxidoreductase [Candidatus Krumholzibacteria bacterium]|nr:SDR family oxidoreductase [Candidatus Krumholzibacteria bacterium]